MSAEVAILAKAPVPGRVKTRLIPPLAPEEAAQVARVCLEETLRRIVPGQPARFTLYIDGPGDPGLLALAAALGVPVLPQAAGDLSARLRGAFAGIRARGASKAIAIGSDSPTLDPVRIAEAVSALDSFDVVIGPSEDGGYYLIGTRGEWDGLFREIPWSTRRVTEVTAARAGEHGLSLAMLPVGSDVDDPEALRRAIEDPIRGLPALAHLLPALGASKAQT